MKVFFFTAQAMVLFTIAASLAYALISGNAPTITYHL